MLKNNVLAVLLCLTLAGVVISQGQSCKDTRMKGNSGSSNQTQENGTAAPEQHRMKGHWGGQDISVEVTDSGATLDFACAHGSISEAIVPDAHGKFAVKGVFVTEHPGPIREDEDTSGQPATYSGTVDGETLTLTITLAGTSKTIGTFTLTFGKMGRVRKCG